MMKFNLYFRFLGIHGLMALLLLSACNEEDSLPPFNVNFANQEIGISESGEVEIIFSRSADNNGEIVLQMNSGNLVYGEENDFYTIPAADNQQLILPFEAGNDKVSFEIMEGSDLNIQQDETITFTLSDDDNGLFLAGQNIIINALFSENFVAREGVIELNGGGEEQTNQAFVDLSKLTQTVVDKNSWHLGFYSESGEHKVILNSSAYLMARPLEKTDLAEVTPADTAGFAAAMQIPQFSPAFGAIAWVDADNGDLGKTAFGDIAPDMASAKVFIVKREGAWQKVKIAQSGDNYQIQYADINSNQIETATVEKDPEYNFTFFSFENKVVMVEPAKNQWDFMYGTFTVSLPLGGGAVVPYGFKDYIVINRTGVSVARVMESDIAYDDFSQADISGLEFSSDQNAIGDSWRQGGGPNSAPSLFTDRYFVLQDDDGQFYKIQFTRLTTPGGERGFPEFIFELVQ
ncbi:MAG: HmuY family protein [Cyclobacteriaceae bacterium]